MHYYKRNIGDYAKKAGRLSIIEHGVYNLLIDACYDRERFPTEEEAIDWVWARTDEEIDAVKFVLKKFFTLDGEVYVQTRIQEELNEYHAMSTRNAEIAQKREEKRTGRQRSVNEASTKRERSVNETPPNQEPLTNNHKPIDKASIVENSSSIGSLCLQMRGLGVTENEQRQKLPEIRQLVTLGAQLSDFADYIEKAKAKNAKKPFGLAIAIMLDEFGKPKPNTRGSPPARSFNDVSLAEAVAQQAVNQRAIEASK